MLRFDVTTGMNTTLLSHVRQKLENMILLPTFSPSRVSLQKERHQMRFVSYTRTHARTHTREVLYVYSTYANTVASCTPYTCAIESKPQCTAHIYSSFPPRTNVYRLMYTCSVLVSGGNVQPPLCLHDHQPLLKIPGQNTALVIYYLTSLCTVN